MMPDPDLFKPETELSVLDQELRGKNGDLDAMLNLGFIFLDGSHGVARDPARAMTWFRMAADRGHDAAQTMMGHFYYRGELVERDLVQAAKWYIAAAEQGNRSAQLKMGELHFLGTGVIQDYVESYKFYNLAAAQNREGAAEMRQKVADLMTREQIAEGQRRAALLADRRAR